MTSTVTLLLDAAALRCCGPQCCGATLLQRYVAAALNAVRLNAAVRNRASRSDFNPRDVLLPVAASTWTFVKDGDRDDRALRVRRQVMDGRNAHRALLAPKPG